MFHQLTHITVDRNCLQNDDRLDSLAGAVEYWNESLAIDEDRAIKDRNGAVEFGIGCSQRRIGRCVGRKNPRHPPR